MLQGAQAPSSDRELPSSAELSPSELRVLRYLPTNLTRSEIAGELFVTVNTVNTHVRSIYSKLGVSDRSSTVQRARELRLLSADARTRRETRPSVDAQRDRNHHDPVKTSHPNLGRCSSGD